MPKTRHVPYAERLARESAKFGLRVGGSLLKHAPGLLGIGLAGLPLALLGMGSRGAEERPGGDLSFTPVDWKTGYNYDENGTPAAVPQDELDRYHNGFI
nr:hypothetical protein [Variovorax boronicumulans]